MKTRTLTPMGSLHPVLFFAVVYAVALLMSVFICSSLFYSCSSSKAEPLTSQPVKTQTSAAIANASLP